tara:strand:+ start:413 stop:844 length:432 start_codon:yes stop_codon:yes gene_type:complete
MITFRKEVFEVFEEYKKADSRETRLDVLKKYEDNWAFKDILRGSFDDSLEFNLPTGRPPFTPNKPESVPSSLLKQHKEFGLYIQGGKGDNLSQFRRENKFIQLLESVHPEDAEYILKMVAKKPPCRYITKKIVQEAFPNLITE